MTTQWWANVLLATGLYILVALPVALSFLTSRYINFNLANCMLAGAYATIFTSNTLTVSLPVAVALGIVSAIALGLLQEVVISRSFGGNAVGSWQMMLVSISLFVIFQALVSTLFGDEAKLLHLAESKSVSTPLGVSVATPQVAIILSASALWAGSLVVLTSTRLGRSIRGVFSNQDLCLILGIDAKRIALVSAGIASGIAGVAGILSASDTGITPLQGFRLLMSGAIVMLISGAGSLGSLVGGAFLLALAQHFVAYHFGSKWMDAVAFVILIGFLIWKPLGFSGRRLKKVEV